jgi:hypothetical protein
LVVVPKLKVEEVGAVVPKLSPGVVLAVEVPKLSPVAADVVA